MAKQKHKVARYQVALNETQNNALKRMMDEDLQTDISSYFGGILVNEWKRRGYKLPIKKTRKQVEEEIIEKIKKIKKEEEKRKQWAILSVNSKK